MRVLVLRHHPEDHPGLIGEALVERGATVEVVLFGPQTPDPTLEGVDLVVVLGSSEAVYDPVVEAAWFGREIALLERAHAQGAAIFGICFGAQALCRLTGGRVERAAEGEVGWFTVEPSPDGPIEPGPWLEYHFDACTPGPGARIWARTPRAVQAFAVGRHVGVQFHPEVDAEQLGEWFRADAAAGRDAGVDARALVAETRQHEPEARRRAGRLVDAVLEHAGLARAR